MNGSDLLAPLQSFYDATGPRLDVTFLPPASLPDPQRHLLHHDGDMTSRLARHHCSEISLDVLSFSVSPSGQLHRASVLRRKDTSDPVEFGAIRIHLASFQESPRQLITQGTVPFGAILQTCAIPFTSHPQAFFQISVDSRLSLLFSTPAGQLLYGRCNHLRHLDSSLLASVVEILPS